MGFGALVLSACVSLGPERPKSYANLNHFYLVLDPTTAEAVAASEVLVPFAFRRVVDAEKSSTFYAGTYLYGYQTYVEIFDPQGFDLRTDVPARVGLFGIAVGGDRIGDLERVADALEQRGISQHRSMRMMTTRDGQELPHFEKLSRAGAPETENYLWAMQYQPELFSLVRETSDNPATQNADPNTVSRAIYNEWRYAPNFLLRDIVGIEATIDPDEESDFASFLKASGFIVTDTVDGFFARGNDIELRFETSESEASGIRTVRFSLNRIVHDQGTHDLGNSRLVIGPGAEARWEFLPFPN